MTVIAYRNGVMASDSLLTDNGCVKAGSCDKIVKVKGWVIGGAGDFDATEAFMVKFDPSVIRKKIYTPFYSGARGSENCALIAVSPRGEIYLFQPSGIFGRVYAPYYSIGIGAQCATGAMAAGASAEAAVKIAIKHIEGCGGSVTVLKIGKG